MISSAIMGHSEMPFFSDAFCLRLTLAMLYRAGLDAMDDQSSHANEAKEFLNSDFAMLALTVLQSKSTRDIDFGDISDYLGHYQRLSKQRKVAQESES